MDAITMDLISVILLSTLTGLIGVIIGIFLTIYTFNTTPGGPIDEVGKPHRKL